MSRRLVIGILLVLILGIVGGTGVLVVQRFRAGSEVAQSPDETGTLEEAAPGSPRVVNPTFDDDADGLTNAQEALWGTDPARSDTDGDGFLDGDEVTNNHNPTVAAPNDTLPPGFRPGQDLQPLDSAPLAADQFFADNLNLQGPQGNLTERYKQQVAPQEQTQGTLLAYVEQQPIVTGLPRVKQEAIAVVQDTSPATLGAYLELAEQFSAMTNPDRVQWALDDLLQNNDASGVGGLALIAQIYQEELLNTRAPVPAEQLHRTLIGYSELLLATYTQMMQYPADPVRGLVGLRQLEVVSEQYAPVIAGEIERLRRL